MAVKCYRKFSRLKLPESLSWENSNGNLSLVSSSPPSVLKPTDVLVKVSAASINPLGKCSFIIYLSLLCCRALCPVPVPFSLVSPVLPTLHLSLI